ncbi:MAG: hypothetical protein ACOC2M_00945 [bacterium]
MKQKVKILVVGGNQDNFVLPLTEAISKASPNIVFNFAEIRSQSTGELIESDRHHIVGLPNSDQGLLKNVLIAFKIIFNKNIYKRFLTYLPFNGRGLRGLSDAYCFYKKQILYSKVFKCYDIINIQYCSAEYMQYAEMIPQKTKLLCSVWGSDLLQNTNPANYIQQYYGFQRADRIVIQNQELKERLLTKFGRYLSDRVVTQIIGVNETILNEIDRYRNDENAMRTFKQHYGIPVNKSVICIGYSASSKHKHIEVLSHFEKAGNFGGYTFLLPLTYGQDKNNIEAVKQFATQSSLSIVIIDQFLSLKNLALLRLSADYFLQTRETDANSNSFLENLYAGALAFAGTWLPYSNFRQKDLFYLEYDEYYEIIEKIASLKIDNYNSKINDNYLNIKRFFTKSSQVQGWVKVFDI